MDEITVCSFNTKGQLTQNLEAFRQRIGLVDIMFLQEVRIHNIEAIQSLKDALSFKYAYSDIFFDFSKDYGKGAIETEVKYEYMVVLSNLELAHKMIALPTIPGVDRWPRLCQVFKHKEHTFTHVHLSKHETSRHQALSTIPRSDCIIGDFNMQPPELKQAFSKYKNSYSFKKYASFKPKGITLDYILLKKGSFQNLLVHRFSFSDHNLIKCTILT